MFKFSNIANLIIKETHSFPFLLYKETSLPVSVVYSHRGHFTCDAHKALAASAPTCWEVIAANTLPVSR